MQKKVFIHTASGQSWDWNLPKVLRHAGEIIMNINEDNMSEHGIKMTLVEIPDPIPVEPILSETLITKERTFALKLKELAHRFNITLTTLPDINIGTLLMVAQDNGVSENDIANASAILLALAKDVEAESGLNWADTWTGLKTRLLSYLTEGEE